MAINQVSILSPYHAGIERSFDMVDNFYKYYDRPGGAATCACDDTSAEVSRSDLIKEAPYFQMNTERLLILLQKMVQRVSKQHA